MIENTLELGETIMAASKAANIARGKRFPTYEDDKADEEFTPSGWPKGHGLKDHDIAKLKNELRDCAVKYHAAEQLRSRLGTVLGRYIK